MELQATIDITMVQSSDLKPIPHKWRAPEDSEQNKRIIDNKPYTYNPTIKGWVADDTLLANLPTVRANLATTQTEIEQLKAKN